MWCAHRLFTLWSVLNAIVLSAQGQSLDLRIWAPSTVPTLSNAVLSTSDCSVVSGCLPAGDRYLFQFDVDVQNMGPMDLSLGDPVGNTNFIYDTCVGEYRYRNWCTYRLRNATNGVVATRQVDACVSDTRIYQPMAMPFPIFTCESPGLQHDWSCVLSGSVSCAALDVTAVPAGDYTLEIEVNADRRIAELSYSNNIIQVPVTLAACHSIAPASRSVQDTPNGNGNGAMDPGETIREWIVLTNTGCTASSVSSVVTSLTPGVTILQGASTYPSISGGSVATNHSAFIYRLPKSISCGTIVTMRQVVATERATFTSQWTRTVGSLQTLATITNTFNATDLSKAIPEFGSVISTVSVSVAGIAILDDVDVLVRIDHLSASDLEIFLQPPWGGELMIGYNYGEGANYGSGNNCNTAIKTIFNDEATSLFTTSAPPFAGSYKPVESLSVLDGNPVSGKWKIRVDDVMTLNDGTFKCAGLRIVYHTAQYVCSTYQSAPTASNVFALAGHTATNLQLAGTDADGDPITFRTNSAPAHGTLSSLSATNGRITYTPVANYVGPDSFTFSVTDGTTTSTTATVFLQVGDADQDGLPDAWEARFFPDPVASLPGADPDGDGSRNWEEYVGDSVPTNALSRLPVITNVLLGQATALQLNWSSTGRLYDAWWCSNLATGLWLPAVTGRYGNGSSLELVFTNNLSVQFYQVRIRLP